jgi:hypothetical protein
MKSKTLLALILAVSFSASQAQAKYQACRGECIKAWNACKADCGGSTATLPWQPVGSERLRNINACVRSQCQQPLGACESKCHAPKPGR